MMPISLIDANDQVAEALLEEQTFLIGMHWNETAQWWTMSIQDFNEVMVVSGIMCTTQHPLTRQFRRAGMFPGELMIHCPYTTKLSRDSFVNGEAVLLYASADEMVAEGYLEYQDA